MLKRSRWPWLALLAIFTAVMGAAGYSMEANSTLTFEDKVVLTLKLFKLDLGFPADPPWPLRLARISGAFFTVGALMKLWFQIFRDQVTDFRLSRMRGHAVICGLGRKGMHLLACLRSGGMTVAAAQKVLDEADCDTCRRLGAILVQGDASQNTMLAKLGVEHAAEVYAVCGDDRTNLEIGLQTLARYRQAASSQPLTCHVHLVELALLHQLQHRDFLAGQPAGFTFNFFNLDELCARRLMAYYPLPPVRSGRDLPVRLVVVGEGPALHAVLLHHARTAHLGDLAEPAATLLCSEPERERAALLGAFPALPQVCRLEWGKFAPGGSEALLPQGFDLKTCRPRVVVLCRGDQESLCAALALRDAGLHPSVPVYVRVADNAGLSRLLDASNAEVRRLNLVPFGSVEEVCGEEVLRRGQLDRLARAYHEVYRRHQAGKLEPASPGLKVWALLPESLRSASRRVADHLDLKLATTGCRRVPLQGEASVPFQFTAAEVELLSRMEHRRWRADRLLAGWRLGARDNARKLHPSLIPWEELSEPEKQKDRDMVTGLVEVLAEAGFGVARD